jgi:hypothetical protein
MGRALNVDPVMIVLGGVVDAIIATPVLAAGSGAFVYLRERRSACYFIARSSSVQACSHRRDASPQMRQCS